MKKSVWNWVTGIAIGCTGILVVCALIGGVGYLFVRDIIQRADEMDRLQEEVKTQQGGADDYVPQADGTIPSERLTAFLRVRQYSAPVRAKLVSSFDNIASDLESVQQGGGFLSIMRLFGRGVGVVPHFTEFYTARSEALLEARMGVGEYFYIYIMAYYTYLKKPLEDGPGVLLVRDDDRSEKVPAEEVPARRRVLVLKRIHRVVERSLANGDGTARGPWKGLLERELTLLRTVPERIPWEDGLPAALSESLEPFRQELEQEYSPLTNPLELTPE